MWIKKFKRRVSRKNLFVIVDILTGNHGEQKLMAGAVFGLVQFNPPLNSESDLCFYILIYFQLALQRLWFSQRRSIMVKSTGNLFG